MPMVGGYGQFVPSPSIIKKERGRIAKVKKNGDGFVVVVVLVFVLKRIR